jgi:hypothetical protein
VVLSDRRSFSLARSFPSVIVRLLQNLSPCHESALRFSLWAADVGTLSADRILYEHGRGWL